MRKGKTEESATVKVKEPKTKKVSQRIIKNNSILEELCEIRGNSVIEGSFDLQVLINNPQDSNLMIEMSEAENKLKNLLLESE